MHKRSHSSPSNVVVNNDCLIPAKYFAENAKMLVYLPCCGVDYSLDERIKNTHKIVKSRKSFAPLTIKDGLDWYL